YSEEQINPWINFQPLGWISFAPLVTSFRLCYPATEVFNVKPRRFHIIPNDRTRADVVVHGPAADQVPECNVIIGKFCDVTEFRCQF
ncbi:hypothetical protein, partial [Pantoea dispersa]|uniref:hypothetical protein n=1 Tax=Pantoea dispersa TaxID=59814 RepID=UPI001BAC8A9C